MRRALTLPLAVFTLLPPLACGGNDAPGAARVITSNQPGALLSGWVEPDGTAYFVGGATGGGSALLLRVHDNTVESIPAGGARPFWWITGTAPGQMWIAGEGGQVHRFDGLTLSPEDTGVPSDATLFGIWGTAPDDMWAVGGGIAEGRSKRVIARRHGGAWMPVTSPDGVSESAVYFKVWGSASDRVFIVGSLGTALRWDGAALSRMEAPAIERYLTVHGCADGAVYAVGGGVTGLLVRSDGGAFAPVAAAPAGLEMLNGVACLGEDVYVGGLSAYAARLRGDAWVPIAAPAGMGSLGIHGIAGRETGPVYAAGGDLFATGDEPRRGFVLRIDDR